MISGQGTLFTWGTVSLSLTSISVSASGNATEITSMSSAVRTDAANTNAKLVVRDYDAGLASEVDVAVEFVAGTALNTQSVTTWVGLSRPISVTFPANDRGQGAGIAIASPAVLTQISLNVSTGDFVRGNASFRLSGL